MLSNDPSSSYFQDRETLSHKTLQVPSEPSAKTAPASPYRDPTMPTDSPPTESSPTHMDIDSTPLSTPDRSRRDKKSRQSTLEPNTTPSKKRCENPSSLSDSDVEMDAPAETQPTETSPSDSNTTKTKKYLRLSSACSDDTIISMSTENLIKEIVNVSSKVGKSLTFDSIKTLPKPVLIQRALDFRKKTTGS